MKKPTESNPNVSFYFYSYTNPFVFNLKSQDLRSKHSNPRIPFTSLAKLP
ncbi:hypothetical protein LEP1GSC187_3949 [Leptospira santarosai str. ZUN179]|uniref:Uncharacterized protein n=1 Tax=Leptospira santarosai str. ZUN179 TaxID=1049985 RepID=M6UNQ6_9LEPT|nr:hypothetical protein LEP1GSC187_3949 [Leptospira santarosai str. ZUN179]